MKSRIVAASLLFIGVGIIVVLAFQTQNKFIETTSFAATVNQPNTDVNAISIPSEKILGAVDGSLNPELISNKTAYSVMLRLLSNRKSDEEKARGRSYIKSLLQLKCGSCNELEKGDGTLAEDEADIDAVFSEVKEFEEKVTAFDNLVEEIKWRNWPDPNPVSIAQLENIQAQKDAMVNETILNLKNKLSEKSRKIFDKRVEEQVKRKIKLIPGPKSSEDEQREFSVKKTP
jgi:hypothetical protein